MNSTFGDPRSARKGRGHAGRDSSVVRPITPVNPVTGSYSSTDIPTSPHLARYVYRPARVSKAPAPAARPHP